MNRFLCAMAIGLLQLTATAQTASTTTHTVGGGDTLYGLVAQYYPERMARWTDVAVDIVALNPNEFPQGLDTVMKLGDTIVLADYGVPLVSATDPAPESTDTAAPAAAAVTRPSNAQASYSAPNANLDVVKPETPVQTVDITNRRDVAPTAHNNSTAPTAPVVDSTSTQTADTTQSTDIAIGRIESVTQRALAIDRDNQRRPLSVNDSVFLGDAITSDENSYVTIRMLDEAQLSLQASSRLMFERYQFDADNQRGSAIITLVKGGFGMSTGRLGELQSEAVTVNTAVATVGIRGTRFALKVCAPNTCRRGNGEALEPGLYTGVLEGAIVVSNNTGDLVTRTGEFFHIAAPNTVPEATQSAASLLFTPEQLALLDMKVEQEKPLSFLGWLKRKLFDD